MQSQKDRPRSLDDLPELCTVEEYAEVTRQGLTKAYADVKAKRIESTHLGRTIRIPRRAIEALVYGEPNAPVLKAVK
jgi:excisionase family DNA binding protein